MSGPINPDMVVTSVSMAVDRDRRGYTFAAEIGGDDPVVFTLPEEKRVGDPYNFVNMSAAHVQVVGHGADVLYLIDGKVNLPGIVETDEVGAMLSVMWDGTYWRVLSGVRTWRVDTGVKIFGFNANLLGIYQEPVAVMNMVDDSDMSAAEPVAPVAGAAYVVNNWGGAHNDGDIEEYNGAAWVTLVTAVDSFPPEGTRVVVAGFGGPAAGGFVGLNYAILESTGTAWVTVYPADAGARVYAIADAGSVYGGRFYTRLVSQPWSAEIRNPYTQTLSWQVAEMHTSGNAVVINNSKFWAQSYNSGVLYYVTGEIDGTAPPAAADHPGETFIVTNAGGGYALEELWTSNGVAWIEEAVGDGEYMAMDAPYGAYTPSTIYAWNLGGGTWDDTSLDYGENPAGLNVRIPEDWAPGTNATLRLFMATGATVLPEGDQIHMKAVYRAVATGDALASGSTTTASGSHTAPGGGDAAYTTFQVDLMLSCSDATNPFVAGNVLGIDIVRDIDPEDYFDLAYLIRAEFRYVANELGGIVPAPA